MSAQIAIQILEAADQNAVTREIRAVTGLPIAEIAKAVVGSIPIPIGELFGRGPSEAEASMLRLLAALEGLGASFHTIVDGVAESKQYLLNRIATFHAIERDVRMETDLELGEPSPEAKEWGRGATNDG